MQLSLTCIWFTRLSQNDQKNQEIFDTQSIPNNPLIDDMDDNTKSAIYLLLRGALQGGTGLGDAVHIAWSAHTVLAITGSEDLSARVGPVVVETRIAGGTAFVQGGHRVGTLGVAGHGQAPL